MTMFVQPHATLEFEGRRLVGEPIDIQLVLGWMVMYGLPLLVDPTPTVVPWSSARMVDPQGRRHTPGVYIHPTKGLVVLRNRYKQTLHGDYGDWIFRDTVNSNFFVVKQLSIDNGTFIELAE